MSASDRSLPAGKFKAKCLSLLDEVASTGRAVVITKRGRPVARLVPAEPLKPGALAGTIRFHGDISAPIKAEWGALR